MKQLMGLPPKNTQYTLIYPLFLPDIPALIAINLQPLAPLGDIVVVLMVLIAGEKCRAKIFSKFPLYY